MTDKTIRERHGCGCIDARDNSRSFISIHEGEGFIILNGDHAPRAMTPTEARYLAAKLYRLSRRVRDRSPLTLATGDKQP